MVTFEPPPVAEAAASVADDTAPAISLLIAVSDALDVMLAIWLLKSPEKLETRADVIED